ncbi:Type I restriction-modification system methyltransferase subunit [plant metagenome]|uniref:site-specific DNA-methyltransferase (adenine-specific) n=1 Tax=plant metagenome TaxID=1297885 RepID=A0A484UHJ9_9ZZZZ
MATKAQQRRFLSNADEHQREIVKIVQQLSHRYDISRVWSDWIEMCALSIANAVDKTRFDVREKRYLEIVKKYQRDEVDQLVRAFGHLVQCWEIRVDTGDYGDVLGATFMMLDMGNDRSGQFFTPYEVSHLMSRMLGLGQDIAKNLEDSSFIRLMEPACGAGGMIIASAHAMRDAGFNYQQQMHVTAIDIDQRCVHMTYLQLALLHVPAVVVHGNALSCEEWDHWYTPAHVLGHWQFRLQVRDAIQATATSNGKEADGNGHAVQAEATVIAAKPSSASVLSASGQRAARAAATAGQMQLF